MNRYAVRALLTNALAAAGLLLSMTQAHAGLVNDVPSCYAANHLPYQSAAPDKLVYVLIDQTVLLDPTLQQSVISNINGMIQPGSKFVIAEFSAFSQGRYLNVLHTGIVEAPLTDAQKGNIPISRLPAFQTCMHEQAQFAIHMADQTARDAMQASTSSLDQSDILSALKMVSAVIQQDPAQHKVLFAVTDGLENSSVTSFYAHNTARLINPKLEFDKAKAAGTVGDFGLASVYVLGGAMMPPATSGTRAERDGYRDPKMLQALEAFWRSYFAASNARLEAFGAPALVEAVEYR